MMKRVAMTITLCLLAGALGGGAGWFFRAEYDRIFMLEGLCHIVNVSNQALDVSLEFPSGHQEELRLSANGFEDFLVRNTGEGGISVTVNQKNLGSVGYVTSMNSIVVLTVAPEEVGFSQIFPSLRPERASVTDG